MAKFDTLFEDQDDLLVGTPKSKFWDISNQANKEIVEDEFDTIISKYAMMEKLLEEYLNEEEIKNKMAQYQLENSSELDTLKKSLYIEFTTNIVCKLES